jgi:hypothetical protein
MKYLFQILEKKKNNLGGITFELVLISRDIQFKQ